MKQRLVWLGAVLLIVGLGVVFARACSPMGHRWYRGGFRHIARELNLSGAQRSQIKSIWRGGEANGRSVSERVCRRR